MSKNIKQIYAALELCENEIRILVGEYYNTRFNIIRADKYPTNAISDFKIVNKSGIIEDIKKAVQQTSAKIGSGLEQVLLVLPAYNFKRFPLRSKVVIEKGVVRKQDIARAVSNSLKTPVDKDVIVVDPMIIKYTINGISSRRFPENEVCSEVYVDIDLLCADTGICYDYVSAAENSGLKVLDIVLNTYATAREAALFEESLNKSIIVLDINRSCTYLSLLSKGKLLSTEIVYDGLNSLINKVYRTYNMPYNDIAKLVKYSVNYNSKYPDDVIYAWSSQNNTNTITTKMLNEAVARPLDSLTEKLITMCRPILDTGASIVITSEGEQMKALSDVIRNKAQCEVRTYYPDTIGVRDPAFTALYGAFFIYRDKVMMNDLSVSCIDLLKYDSLIDHKQMDLEGETITTKIKSFFRQVMEKGGNQ